MSSTSLTKNVSCSEDVKKNENTNRLRIIISKHYSNFTEESTIPINENKNREEIKTGKK
jgi:hypothetical protein